ncbi:MAG: bifunctional aminoglycoside phosphotransferase/ATP-binding protein [Burkholderiaceae bacterium]
MQIFETHISWIVVTDKFAYKFKKAVHFDFVDFSTLDARHFYCQEELRLNRRLAPDLYLGVVSITGSIDDPLIDGTGGAIEYAVKMNAFPQQALWSERLKMKCLSLAEIDALAKKIADFHRNTAIAPTNSTWGSHETIQKTAIDNLTLIASLAESDEEKRQVCDIESWQTTQHKKLSGTFTRRKANGLVKECHGDLHSGNILTIDGHVEVFDCIEFNENLRWIDVVNDIAFICMDLHIQDKPELAARLLNQYLELTGDYDGLVVLHYYQTQRALVRCKVGLMRARQLRSDAQDAALFEKQAAQYLTFSVDSMRKMPAAIMITHGLSGSGKSTFAKCLVEVAGAIQIRSDVERKRMYGLAATSRVGAAFDATLYSSASTQMTYDRLLQMARHIAEAGMLVIVDAAFLKKAERSQFKNLAHELNVPFFIFDVHASEAVMKERIAQRTQMNRDPSDADIDVLERQLIWNEPLTGNEMKCAIVIDTERNMGMDDIRKILVTISGEQT